MADHVSLCIFANMLHQNRLSFIGAPLFVQQRCKVTATQLDIAWEPIEYNPPITAYILELGQDNNNFSEVCFFSCFPKRII